MKKRPAAKSVKRPVKKESSDMRAVTFLLILLIMTAAVVIASQSLFR